MQKTPRRSITPRYHRTRGEGYVVVAPDPAEPRPNPPYSDWVVRLTRAGGQAQEIWRPLFGAIEERWQTRFGKREIAELRESLWALTEVLSGQMGVELPDDLPIPGHGLCSRGPGARYGRRRGANAAPAGPDFLCRRSSRACCWRSRSSSRASRSCRSRSVRVSCEFLMSRGAGPRPSASDGRIEGGHRHGNGHPPEERRCRHRAGPKREPVESRSPESEKRWHAHFGKNGVRSARRSIERLVGEPTVDRSPLFRGFRAVSRRVAGVGPEAQHAAAQSDGVTPGRVPRRQLGQTSNYGAGALQSLGPESGNSVGSDFRSTADHPIAVST
jgi:hypothetical protein